MKTIEINEKSLLIVFERNELSKYLPNGDFDISDMRSRKALRGLLSVALGKTGGEVSPRIKLEMFGSADTEVNIFCTFDGPLADSFT